MRAERANATEFGLGGSVWTSDPEGKGVEVANQIESGSVWINDHMGSHPSAPFGGVKMSEAPDPDATPPLSCANGQCPRPSGRPSLVPMADALAPRVVNSLRGSRKRSAERPHAFVIDADFVTCTQ